MGRGFSKRLNPLPFFLVLDAMFPWWLFHLSSDHGILVSDWQINREAE